MMNLCNSRQRVANAKLIKENEELKEENKRAYAKYINCRKTESKFEYILTEFEKWLEEEIEKINNLINPKKGIKPYGEELNILETIRNVYMDCKDKLKELKEGRRNDT